VRKKAHGTQTSKAHRSRGGLFSFQEGLASLTKGKDSIILIYNKLKYLIAWCIEIIL